MTVASRREPPPAVRRSAVVFVPIDRRDPRSVAGSLGSRRFDLVYDQLCFDGADARLVCEVFGSRIGRYVFASSQAVYPAGPNQREGDLPPGTAPLERDPSGQAAYSEGKREAENTVVANLQCPSLAVRFAQILGPDDPAGRLERPVSRMIRSGFALVENPDARVSLCDSDDAARFLDWLLDRELNGAVNACSPDAPSLREILRQISRAIGSPIEVRRPGGAPDPGPYRVHTRWEQDDRIFPLSVAADWSMDSSRALGEGFRFAPTCEWLPGLLAGSRAVGGAGPPGGSGGGRGSSWTSYESSI